MWGNAGLCEQRCREDCAGSLVVSREGCSPVHHLEIQTSRFGLDKTRE